MAKASDRKGVRTDEGACCAATRRKLIDSIRRNYLSFPVIRRMACPECKMILNVKVFERPEDEAAEGRA
ncbi:MAG: hypothetical protein RL698_2717 [Pseudomonadota bacterium]|jgi:hypothetical protein